MVRLVALLVTFGVVVVAGAASATIYVPGQYRDGVYTRPHFLDAPNVRFERDVKMNDDEPKPPKPTILDEPQSQKKLPPDSPS